jgi:hypothetical protein
MSSNDPERYRTRWNCSCGATFNDAGTLMRHTMACPEGLSWLESAPHHSRQVLERDLILGGQGHH